MNLTFDMWYDVWPNLRKNNFTCAPHFYAEFLQNCLTQGRTKNVEFDCNDFLHSMDTLNKTKMHYERSSKYSIKKCYLTLTSEWAEVALLSFLSRVVQVSLSKRSIVSILWKMVLHFWRILHVGFPIRIPLRGIARHCSRLCGIARSL